MPGRFAGRRENTWASKAKQIEGNFKSRVFLRVVNEKTAEIITRKLHEVRLITLVAASSATDTNDPSDFAEFAGRNEDRIASERTPMLASRPGQSAQGPSLCAHRRWPTLQDTDAIARQRERPGDAERLCGDGERYVATLPGASGGFASTRYHGGRQGQWLLDQRRFVAATRAPSLRHSVTWPT